MNVHGIRDDIEGGPPASERRLRPGQNRPEGGQGQGQEQDNGAPWGGMNFQVGPQQLQFAQEHKVLFISGGKQLTNPREQDYWDMMMINCCPNWQCISLTMLLVLVELGMFIGQAIYGISKAPNAQLLSISRETLLKFGANNGLKVHSGQVYRLLSAIFVHLDLIHLFGNLFATFILVSRIEYTLGTVKTLIIFLLTGIGGNIFSLAVDSGNFELAVKGGASTALFGMLGLILGYIIINWSGLALLGQTLRCQIICVFFFMLIVALLFTPGTSDVIESVDHLGHLGGFLTGVWLSFAITPIKSQTRQTTIRIVFVSLFLIQMLATFLGFFLTH